MSPETVLQESSMSALLGSQSWYLGQGKLDYRIGLGVYHTRGNMLPGGLWGLLCVVPQERFCSALLALRRPSEVPVAVQ